MRKLRVMALGLVSSLAVLASQPARAGLLLEPYVGYQLGKYTVEGAPNTNFDLSAADLGLRLGLTFPLLFVALDYSTLLSGGSMKQDDGPGTKWDASGSQLFAEVGANLPIVRAYLGYGLMNTLDGKQNGYEVKSEGGTAIKAGLGASLLPFISFNLEYVYSNFDKCNANPSIKSHANTYMLSLSLPFDI